MGCAGATGQCTVTESQVPSLAARSGAGLAAGLATVPVRSASGLQRCTAAESVGEEAGLSKANRRCIRSSCRACLQSRAWPTRS